MKFTKLIKYLDTYLRVADFSKIDSALNGLQVAADLDEVERAAFVVDASMAAFELAARQKAQIVIAHHGLFWGRQNALTGAYFERVKFLVKQNMGLYAVHLPLDAHPEVGNNIVLAQALGLADIRPFGEYHGKTIGFMGSLPRALDVEGLLKRLDLKADDCLGILPFGPEKNRQIAVISGAAVRQVEQALAAGADLYLTGDLEHQVYHLCLEEKINIVAGGHYFTETFGVRALADKVAADTGVTTFFIDSPTRL